MIHCNIITIMISSFSIQDFTHDKMFQNIFATVKFCCRKICHCYCNFYTHSTSSPQLAKDTEKFSRQDHLLHFRAFKPSYTFSWVGRVLPETKFKNKWTLFFELFDLSDHYIFEHLSLHIHFRGWGGSSQKQN